MMKKYSFILWVALTMTSVFIACTDNESPMSEQTEVKPVTILATIDGDLGSRVTLTDDAGNRVVKVDWAQGDDFKINVNGSEYIFVYDTSTGAFAYDGSNGAFPETFSSAVPVTATYPASPPSAYGNQTGTLAGTAVLLTMTATLDVEAGQSTEDLNLNFKHNNSIVKMTLGNEAFKEKSVTGITLKSGSTVVTTVSEPFTGDTENGSIVVYFAVEPKAMTDISILAVCEESNYITTLTDNTLQSGKLYNVNKTLVGLKNAGQAVKGDLAMADGTFISKDDIENLTDALKGEVRGIVFWTEDEEGTATLLGDNADKIMQTEFEDCNHGLIVALTDVSTGCTWTDSYEYIYSQFQNTGHFTPTNKSDYKSIATYINDYNLNNINSILGYQNTKVLEAYNKYCSETSGKESYKVNPVAELANWKTKPGNEAPENTTGWFIPSIKELHMLWHKDDSCKQFSTETRDAIDLLIEALGGTKLGDNSYWSSSENTTNYSAKFCIISNGRMVAHSVSYDYHVRAVCAF